MKVDGHALTSLFVENTAVDGRFSMGAIRKIASMHFV
jgi:hypothetical protein